MVVRNFSIDGSRTLRLIGGALEQERPHPFSTHAALAACDVEAAVAGSEQHGVTYVSPARQSRDVTTRPDGARLIYFQDPDAHWLEINDAKAVP